MVGVGEWEAEKKFIDKSTQGWEQMREEDEARSEWLCGSHFIHIVVV